MSAIATHPQTRYREIRENGQSHFTCKAMTTHPTPRRTLFTVALCCLLPQSTIAKGLPRARPEDVGLSATALERMAPTLQSHFDSGQFPGLLAVIARLCTLAYLYAGGLIG